MAIRQYLENNKKLYEVYIHGHNSKGERVQRKRRGIENMRKAESVEFELKREMLMLKEQKVEARWNEWVSECLSIMKINFRPSTPQSYQCALNKWINPHFDQKELGSISKMNVHDFLFECMPGSTIHTKKYVLKIIKRVFQMAVDHGKCDRNPCQGMALFTGMRSGELYALRWSDVDLDGGIIQVGRSWSSKNGFTTTKNQKTRQMPISDQLLYFLSEHKFKAGGEEFVLPHLTECTRGGVAEVTRNFCKSLGLTEIKFHNLRATFITNLLSRGESLARVMAVVGHADMETTNVYLRKAGIELKGATDKLGYSVPQTNDAIILKFSK